MSRCWALTLRCGKFVVQQVVELLRACPLVVLYNMFVAGVRVVEFGTSLLQGLTLSKGLMEQSDNSVTDKVLQRTI